jgi:hypothetical protein
LRGLGSITLEIRRSTVVRNKAWAPAVDGFAAVGAIHEQSKKAQLSHLAECAVTPVIFAVAFVKWRAQVGRRTQSQADEPHLDGQDR